MKLSLEEVERIRKQAGVSYRRAAEALKAAEGDVVAALADLEQNRRSQRRQEDLQTQMAAKGEKLVERLADLLQQGNVTSVRVMQEGRTILELPATVGVVGAFAFPRVTAAGLVAAIATDCTIVIEKEAEPTVRTHTEVSEKEERP